MFEVKFSAIYSDRRLITTGIYNLDFEENDMYRLLFCTF